MEAKACSQRAPILWVLIPWVLGLVVGKVLGPHANPPVLMCIGVTLAALSIWGACRPGLWGTALCAGVVCLGAGWYPICRHRLPEWDDRPPREAALVIEVERLFAAHKDLRKVGGLGRVVNAPPHLIALTGQVIQFSGRLRPGAGHLLRSSIIGMVGQLEVVPRAAPPGTFDGYLASAGVNFKLSRGRILKERTTATAYWRWCDRLQTAMSDAVARGLEDQPELVAVLRAVLLGSIGELNERQDTWFTESGTLHLFSVSGLHIGVIAIALSGLFAVLRTPPWARLFLLLLLIWLYVDITGRAPSAVRAFLMVALLHGAKVARCPANPASLLAVSAMLVLVVDPLQLFSASFQMSYGIVLALMLLGLPLARAWEERWTPFHGTPRARWTWWHRLFAWIWKGAIGSVAVGVATSPVSLVTGILYFGLATPGAIAANLVSIPLASIGLLGGLSSVVASACGEVELGIVFNHAAALALAGINHGAERFVAIPGVSWMAQFRTPTAGYASLTILFALILAGFQWGWTRRAGGFWPPFAFTGLVAIFLVTFPGG